MNLLAGRAWTCFLYPLVWPEYSPEQLDRVLATGAIPSVLDSPRPWDDLREYVGVSLAEGIRAEALARSIEAFSRFLSVAALTNGAQLDFTSVGSDAQVPPRTVRELVAVLEDTPVGDALPPYQRTKKRKGCDEHVLLLRHRRRARDAGRHGGRTRHGGPTGARSSSWSPTSCARIPRIESPDWR